MPQNEPSRESNGAVNATGLLEFIQQRGTVLSVPASSSLYREGEPCDGLYYVEAGEIELAVYSGERKLVLGVARSGTLLGLPCAFRSAEHSQTATAIQDCRVVFVESPKMREFLQSHAESCLQSIQMLGTDILELSTNMIRPLRLQPRYPKNH